MHTDAEPAPAIEPVAINLAHFLEDLEMWGPRLTRMMAADEHQLHAVVFDLATEREASALFTALESFASLARRCEAAAALFQAGHDRMLAVAETLTAER